MHKLFDNGEGRTTIAGGQGTMWTTLLQMGELVDTANRVYDPTETRVFVTHASPAREGLLNQLSVTLKADFSISAGLHFRYGSSYNEFSVNPTLDHYRGKLAASKASFSDVWETVKSEVEPAVQSNDAQQTLLNNALDIVSKMPAVANGGNPFGGGQVSGQVGVGTVDESAFKNMWNFNLADAAFGYLVLEIQDGRIGTEMRAQGFNFAHRSTGGKPPASQQTQAPAPPPASTGNAMHTGRGPAPPQQPSQQYNQSPQAPQQPRVQQPPAQVRPPPTQQPSQSSQQPQQNKPTPAPLRGPAPVANTQPQNPVKPATPQPAAPSAATTSSPKPPPSKTPNQGEVRNGTADGTASPAPEKKSNTRLFVSGADNEQIARDQFTDEDKPKIVKMETIGSKSNFIVHFATHEDADGALKRQRASGKGGKSLLRVKWFEDRSSNRPRDSTGGPGAGTWQGSNRQPSGPGPRPNYQSGASDSEGTRGRGGYRGRGGGRGGDRGRGGGRGGRGGAKGGDDSSTPTQQENKPPASAAPAGGASSGDKA